MITVERDRDLPIQNVYMIEWISQLLNILILAIINSAVYQTKAYLDVWDLIKPSLSYHSMSTKKTLLKVYKAA